MPRIALVVRKEPEPLLGVVGRFDAAGRSRLEGLRWQIETALPEMRYVGYEQAERDCEILAEKLVERFGREELRSFRFTAVPRGGFVVLGMLSYILGLSQEQLETPHSSEAPLVVVDDCALSGDRFRRFLARTENERVVFAHLYSPLELRRAVEARERGVVCIGAHDLVDHAPDRQGGGYAAWRERWLRRMDDRGYWVGQPEHVCFAWNEPDISIWNPVTEREEGGWRLVPPKLCLKNRPAPGAEVPPVQVQSAGRGPLKPSPAVLFGELEGEVVVGDIDSGASFVLEGAGADMWRAIVEYGGLEEATSSLLEEYEVDEETLKRDLESFAENLLEQRLLVHDG